VRRCDPQAPTVLLFVLPLCGWLAEQVVSLQGGSCRRGSCTPARKCKECLWYWLAFDVRGPLGMYNRNGRGGCGRVTAFGVGVARGHGCIDQLLSPTPVPVTLPSCNQTGVRRCRPRLMRSPQAVNLRRLLVTEVEAAR
jgi:hypothetical protein